MRSVTFFISALTVLFAMLTGMHAPALLFMGVMWFIVAVLFFTIKRKIDCLSFVVSAINIGLLLCIYFIPIWILELKANTPEEYLIIADSLTLRGQILGNKTKAQAYYLKAAEGGNIVAQSRIGEGLYYGNYGVTNRKEGIKWLKIAANNGHKSASDLLRSITP